MEDTLNTGPSSGDFRGDFQLRIQNNNSLSVNLGPNENEVDLFVLKLELSASPASDVVSVFRNSFFGDDDFVPPIAQLTGLDLDFTHTTFARSDPLFGDQAPSSEEVSSIYFDEIYQGATYYSVVPFFYVDASADFNCDGLIDTNDFGFFVGEFNRSPTGGPPFSDADFNEDGLVDGNDFGIFVGEYNTNPQQVSQSNAVPEPTSAILITLGVLALAARRTT